MSSDEPVEVSALAINVPVPDDPELAALVAEAADRAGAL